MWFVSALFMLLYVFLFMLGYEVPGVEQVVAFVDGIPPEYIYLAAFLAILIEGLYVIGVFFPGTTFVAIFVILSQTVSWFSFSITIFAIFLGWVLAGLINIAFAYFLKRSHKKDLVQDSKYHVQDKTMLTWLPVFRANYEVAQILEGGSVSKVLISSIKVRVYASLAATLFLYIAGLFIEIGSISNSEGFITLAIVGVVIIFVASFKFKSVFQNSKYKSSMSKKEETIATYDTAALGMAQKFRDLGARVKDIERGFELVGKENPNVLEIGCGDGRDAKEITRKTDKYHGIDISKSMIAVASEYVPNASFEVADAEEYSFPKELDLIFSFASLLHSNKESVEKVLKYAYDALNPGGIFYISLKHDEYHEGSKTDEFGTRTYYFYTPELIKELAGEKYTAVFEDVHDLRGQKWFVIALRKN